MTQYSDTKSMNSINLLIEGLTKKILKDIENIGTDKAVGLLTKLLDHFGSINLQDNTDSATKTESFTDNELQQIIEQIVRNTIPGEE